MSAVEQRQSNRVRSFLRGEAVHSNGSSRTECTVRDLSDTGARVEIPTSVTLPEYFEIVIPLKNITRRARIVWRHGGEIGILFANEAQGTATAIAAGQSTGDTQELRRRMFDLEAETARLRAQLAQMQIALETLNEQRKIA